MRSARAAVKRASVDTSPCGTVQPSKGDEALNTTQRTEGAFEKADRGLHGPLPGLSLLVCTLGRGDCLVRLFESLTAQTRRDFEVVLVDQNPCGTLDAIVDPFRQRLDIVHVRSSPGLSRARNVGLAFCSAPLVAFPDDDCWYPPDLVAQVADGFAADPGLMVLMGRTVDSAGRESLGSYLRADARIDRRNVWSAGNSNSLFVRCVAARAVGGFDESLGVGAPTPFKSGEETDFLLRILASGGDARFRRDLLVHHDQVSATDAVVMARRAKAYSPGFGRVLRLHHYGVAYLGFRLLRTAAGVCIALARRDVSGARYKAIWAWGTASGYAGRVPPVLHGTAAIGKH